MRLSIKHSARKFVEYHGVACTGEDGELLVGSRVAPDGTRFQFNSQGLLHSDDSEPTIVSDGSNYVEFCRKGQTHRDRYAPAIISIQSGYVQLEYWYYNELTRIRRVPLHAAQTLLETVTDKQLLTAEEIEWLLSVSLEESRQGAQRLREKESAISRSLGVFNDYYTMEELAALNTKSIVNKIPQLYGQMFTEHGDPGEGYFPLTDPLTGEEFGSVHLNFGFVEYLTNDAIITRTNRERWARGAPHDSPDGTPAVTYIFESDGETWVITEHWEQGRLVSVEPKRRYVEGD